MSVHDGTDPAGWRQPTITPVRTETIQCPECNTIQDATIEQVEGAPWPSFVHNCEKCKYTIMESEWETVEIKPCLQYLDELRESGKTNMFGAVPYLMQEFGWGKEQREFAAAVLSYWARTFGKRKGQP